jgi:uncharacterized protein (TIGR02246 family)
MTLRRPRGGRRPSAPLSGRVAVGIAVLTLAAGCAPANRSDEARAQILKLDGEWSKAAEARDTDRTLSYWSDDAVVYPPGRAAIVGKPAIREYVVQSFQVPGFGISWKTTGVEVASGGDLAYATGTNRVTFTGPDGKPAAVEGKAVTVWRREPSGDWKCVVDIWNDTPKSEN